MKTKLYLLTLVYYVMYVDLHDMGIEIPYEIWNMWC